MADVAFEFSLHQLLQSGKGLEAGSLLDHTPYTSLSGLPEKTEHWTYP